MLFPSEQFINSSSTSCHPWITAGRYPQNQQYEDPLKIPVQSSAVSWDSLACVDAGSMQLYCTFKKSPPGSKAGNADVSSCRTSETPFELGRCAVGRGSSGRWVFARSVQKGVDLPAKSVHSDAWAQERVGGRVMAPKERTT